MGKSKQQEKLGSASYDNHEHGNAWWEARAKDKPHQDAYKNIAKFIAKKVKKQPERIIDFACGPGFLIKHMHEQMPNAHIVGLDESEQAIDAANQYLSSVLNQEQLNQISCKQMPLPNFQTGLRKADVVVFSFPDFRISGEQKWLKKWKQVFPKDWEESKAVSKHLKKLYDDEVFSDAVELFVKRVASRNIISLAKKDALIVRVEYSGCKREECDPCYLEEMAWYECTNAEFKALKGKRRDKFTHAKFIKSKFYKSKVILDVYEQTKDKDDKKGGFFISAFKPAKRK